MALMTDHTDPPDHTDPSGEQAGRRPRRGPGVVLKTARTLAKGDRIPRPGHTYICVEGISTVEPERRFGPRARYRVSFSDGRHRTVWPTHPYLVLRPDPADGENGPDDPAAAIPEQNRAEPQPGPRHAQPSPATGTDTGTDHAPVP